MELIKLHYSTFFNYFSNLKGEIISVYLYVGPHKKQEKLFLDQMIGQNDFTHQQKGQAWLLCRTKKNHLSRA